MVQLLVGFLFSISCFVSQGTAAESRVSPVPDVQLAEVPELTEALQDLSIQLGELEENGFFRRRPPKQQPPTNPQTPDSPIEFEFPDPPVEESPADSEATDVGFRDWEPEDWASFFEKILYFVTAISGLFAGKAASNAEAAAASS